VGGGSESGGWRGISLNKGAGSGLGGGSDAGRNGVPFIRRQKYPSVVYPSLSGGVPCLLLLLVVGEWVGEGESKVS